MVVVVVVEVVNGLGVVMVLVIKLIVVGLVVVGAVVVVVVGFVEAIDVVVDENMDGDVGENVDDNLVVIGPTVGVGAIVVVLVVGTYGTCRLKLTTNSRKER